MLEIIINIYNPYSISDAQVHQMVRRVRIYPCPPPSNTSGRHWVAPQLTKCLFPLLQAISHPYMLPPAQNSLRFTAFLKEKAGNCPYAFIRQLGSCLFIIYNISIYRQTKKPEHLRSCFLFTHSTSLPLLRPFLSSLFYYLLPCLRQKHYILP